MERMYGIDRAARFAGGVGELAGAISLTERTLRMWIKDDPKRALGRVIERVGSGAELARRLGASQTAVSTWLRGDVPAPQKPEPKNGIERAVAAAGGQPAMGARLGVTQQAVAGWVKAGYAPPARAQEIEMHYGVPRAELISPKLRNAMGTGGDL
jgi:DNA-binding transcriptional regulator YdaS (Cro superfamily)